MKLPLRHEKNLTKGNNVYNKINKKRNRFQQKNDFQIAHCNFKISCVSPSWIIMTCNGCSIFLCQNKGQSEHLKMAAPIKFESQNELLWNDFFLSKTPSFQTDPSCNHHFLWPKVIFMQKWRFYVLNTNTNFYWTTKHASNYQREPMARRDVKWANTAEITVKAWSFNWLWTFVSKIQFVVDLPNVARLELLFETK